MNFTFKLKSSFLLLIFFASLGQAQQVNVLFVPPGAVRYWHDVTIPMAPAAKKLGINLTIKPIGNTGRVNYEERVLELINSVTNIEWIIWSQRRLATQKILDAMKNRQIKSIDITSGLFKDVQKNWLPTGKISSLDGASYQ